MREQRAFTLVETAIAVSLVAVAAGGCLAAFAGVARMSAPDPARQAAEATLARVVNVAEALSKYSGTVALGSASWTASVPHPNGTPIPLVVTATETSLGANSSALSISVAYPGASGAASVAKTLTLVEKAPPPGASATVPAADPHPAP